MAKARTDFKNNNRGRRRQDLTLEQLDEVSLGQAGNGLEIRTDAELQQEDLAAAQAAVLAGNPSEALRYIGAAMRRAENLQAKGVQIAETTLTARRSTRTIRNDLHQLEQQAARDPLTGVYNRGYFNQSLAQELTTATAEKSVALLLLDLDHFKRVNDTHGHLSGDEIIKRFATLLTRKTRAATDIVARYGGEEFAIIVTSTQPGEPMKLAERIRAALEKMPADLAASPPIPAVTASIGVAQWEPGMTSDAMIAYADAALYVAKREGRNRAHLARSPNKWAAPQVTPVATPKA